MHYTLQQRIVIVEAYIWTGSIKETRERFAHQFLDREQAVLKKKASRSWWKSAIKRVQCVMPRRTESLIRTRLEGSLKESTRHLAQQFGVSGETCQRVLKQITSISVQQLKEPDKGKRLTCWTVSNCRQWLRRGFQACCCLWRRKHGFLCVDMLILQNMLLCSVSRLTRNGSYFFLKRAAKRGMYTGRRRLEDGFYVCHCMID